MSLLGLLHGNMVQSDFSNFIVFPLFLYSYVGLLSEISCLRSPPPVWTFLDFSIYVAQF